MSEERFRERRSAFVDETETAEGPSPAEPATAEPVVGREPVPEPVASAEPAATPEPARERPRGGEELYDVPDPSFLEIVELLAFQALQLMGENPLGVEGRSTVHPEQAKRFIDMIAILQERTRTSLDPGEAQALEQVLADLRVRFLRLEKS